MSVIEGLPLAQSVFLNILNTEKINQYFGDKDRRNQVYKNVYFKKLSDVLMVFSFDELFLFVVQESGPGI